MVSRYRDIIEGDQTPLLRTTSLMSARSSVRNGKNSFLPTVAF